MFYNKWNDVSQLGPKLAPFVNRNHPYLLILKNETNGKVELELAKKLYTSNVNSN